jgi:hypothetical protein
MILYEAEDTLSFDHAYRCSAIRHSERNRIGLAPGLCVLKMTREWEPARSALLLYIPALARWSRFGIPVAIVVSRLR